MRDDDLADLLRETRTIAVVGCSRRPWKDAHTVPKYLKEHGYDVVPVNPNAQEVLGERAYPDLVSIPPSLGIDIVDVFRPSDEVPQIVTQAIRIGAKAVWTQLGISDEEAKRRAERHGVPMIQDLCIKTEHARLLRRRS